MARKLAFHKSGFNIEKKVCHVHILKPYADTEGSTKTTVEKTFSLLILTETTTASFFFKSYP